MGFVMPDTTYRLVFDQDTDLAGFEVRLRALSVDDLLTLAQTVAGVEDAVSEVDQIRQVAPVVDVLAAGILSWNMQTEAGEPIPPSRHAVGRLTIAVLTRVAREWMTAAAGVPAPLGGSSTSGPPAPEASLPMEALSGNQSS